MRKLIQLLSALMALLSFSIDSFADTPILTPGETYVIRRFISKGNLYNISGPEYHSFEITTYQDGTASGIYLIGLKDYYDIASRINLTGRWSYVSRYDKRVVKLFLENREADRRFYTVYVDENLNAYLDDLNNRPEKLYKKSDLDAEKREEEEQLKREAEEERLAEERYRLESRRNRDELISLMAPLRVYFEIIDLGLSVKWANVNMDKAFYFSATNPEDFLGAQLDNLGEMQHTCRVYDKRPIFTQERKYVYSRDEQGKAIIRTYSDVYDEYVAGGSKHGNPARSFEGDHIRMALESSLSHNPNPSMSALQDQEGWVKANQQSQHYPTTAEWQELMDNCIITGVETNPVRNDSIVLAYYQHYTWRPNKFLNVKLLRLTSKVNGNSIVLPFDSRNGTNYATSQYLSSNPDEVTCVHVDANGLSFLEVNREDEIAHRCVFGEINMSILESGIQVARDKYPGSPYMLEQNRMRDELEKQLMNGMLSIGAPSITVKEESNRRYFEIKAPIISGKITNRSSVLVAIDTDIEDGRYSHILWNAKIHDANDSSPAYIVLSNPSINFLDKNPKTGELIKLHSVYFISDNYLSRPKDKEIRDDVDFRKFLRKFNYGSISGIMKRGFNNAFEQETYRRLVVTPATYFSINSDNTIKYESGPAPIPQVGTPEILNMGTYKGNGTYQNVEIGFDIIESDSPFQHPQTQSFNLSIISGDKAVKSKYIETIGNKRKYIVKKLVAGIPYTFNGYSIDQYGVKYESSETITLNADGTASIESEN